MLMAGTRLAFVAVAMAVSISVITFAQTPESAIESIPTEEAVASEVAASLAGDENSTEDNTSVETNPPASSTIPSEVEAENQRLINELRSELLDDRADYIDRWLSVIGVVLTFFGIVVAIVGVAQLRTCFRGIHLKDLSDGTFDSVPTIVLMPHARFCFRWILWKDSRETRALLRHRG